MDYNKLSTLIAVAEAGSITGAAQRIFRTQPAVSQQIRSLESQIGFPLLERRNGRIHLTPEGREVLASASEHLSAIDAELARLKDGLRIETGLLRIGVVSEFANSVLTPRLGVFRQCHPGIDLHIELGTSEIIETALIADRLDVGLIVTFHRKGLFETAPCAIEPCIAVASPAFVKSAGPFRSHADIAGTDIVDFDEDFICMALWLRKNAPSAAAQLAGRRPGVVIKDHTGILEIVRAGLGVAILPRRIADADLAAGALVELLPDSVPTTVTLDVAVRTVRRHRHLNRLIADFLALESSNPGAR